MKLISWIKKSKNGKTASSSWSLIDASFVGPFDCYFGGYFGGCIGVSFNGFVFCSFKEIVFVSIFASTNSELLVSFLYLVF